MNDGLNIAKLIGISIAVFVAVFFFVFGIGLMFAPSPSDYRATYGALFIAIGAAIAVPTALVVRGK